MYKEPLAANQGVGTSPPVPAFINRSGFAYMYKTRQDIGHIAMQALRHARRILVSSPAPDDTKTEMAASVPLVDTSKTKESLLSRTTLKRAVKLTNEPLCSIKTVFPIKLFSDEIVLDRTKITVTRRNFFFSSDTMSIRVEDVLNVSVGVGPFFGAITIATRVLSSDDHFTLNRFWRRDATHMKHMIQGFVIARHNNIDIDQLRRDDLIRVLTELGYDSHRDKYFN